MTSLETLNMTEEILNKVMEDAISYSCNNGIISISKNYIYQAMELYGKQEYNKALNDAVENATTKVTWISIGDYSERRQVVDPNSILKLLKP